MREQIIEILKGSDKDSKKNKTFNDIASSLNLYSKDEKRSLQKCLEEMIDTGDLHKARRDSYGLKSVTEVKGRLVVTRKGYGFVEQENSEDDILVRESDMNGAMHGDVVMVRLNSRTSPTGKLSGRVISVEEKNPQDGFVGEYVDGRIILDDKRYKINIVVKPEDKKNLVNGHKVKIKIGAPDSTGIYEAEIIKILGHKDDVGVDILSCVYSYDIEPEFSDDVMKEVELIPDEVSSSDLTGRQDLRQKTIFTIDGDGAKDFDDAVSIEKLPNGNCLLGVHIADVSYYVKKGTALYESAKDRGTSVYLIDRVIPMLPHKLSNGICSLNEGVDRLTLTCDMEMDNKGNVLEYYIYPSVIKSSKRMTYNNVNKILENNETPSGYEPFVQNLQDMKVLADVIRKAREQRGSTDFDIDEILINVDENGVPVSVSRRERGMGEKLIEDFMIIANETVASHFEKNKIPSVYRTHGKPKMEKMQRFITFANAFLVSMGINSQIKGNYQDPSPKDIQNLLNYLKDTIKDHDKFTIFSKYLLRCMEKAIYQINNEGHFGLASTCYTHFTSPIRRFPDQTVHGLLWELNVFKWPTKEYTFNAFDAKELEIRLTGICENSSLRERNAENCERDVDDMKAAEYMSKHIGEQFTGIISNVVSTGLFIILPNLIEGFVAVYDLIDDHYVFDNIISMIGQNNKCIYRVGDKVDVIVKEASKEESQIDFIMAKDAAKLKEQKNAIKPEVLGE